METKLCHKSFFSLLCRLEWGFQILQIFLVVLSRLAVGLKRICFVVRDASCRIISAFKRLQGDVWNLTGNGSSDLRVAVEKLTAWFFIVFFQAQFSAISKSVQSTNSCRKIFNMSFVNLYMREYSCANTIGSKRQNKHNSIIVSPGLLLQFTFAIAHP
ncbi:hypothetical protein BC643_2224 [Mangrovibacterium diazotrophicum]|uniref:Uncharacterized protein n=1 Tax=Mangrovibacterium diazotrophicum TaxID=1261403 RepID=A0A419W8T6_9BACT|nr:hypothetical protein BC643_2224 [Mangrovibacterium diazotrophicum]